MTKKQKIFNIVFMTVLFGAVIYLSIALRNKNEIKIDLITLDGNFHLSKEQYLSYANLLDRNEYGNLTLQIIKDRIEKHPFIAKANVKHDGGSKVSINIIEKTFESILIENDKQFLLTDQLQVLPFLPKTSKIDFPIIANPRMEDSIKVLSSLKKNNDVLTASKILTGIKLLSPELYDGLSIIDMRKGGDVLLSFSLIDYPVVVGRGNEIKKMVYFNNLWTYLKGKKINNYMNYVDLRYRNHVFFGIQKDSISMGEKNNSSLRENS